MHRLYAGCDPLPNPCSVPFIIMGLLLKLGYMYIIYGRNVMFEHCVIIPFGRCTLHHNDKQKFSGWLV